MKQDGVRLFELYGIEHYIYKGNYGNTNNGLIFFSTRDACWCHQARRQDFVKGGGAHIKIAYKIFVK